METKLQIIHTDDYILAVSDEGIKEGDLFTNNHGQISKCVKSLEEWLKINQSEIKKIIAYKPKGNAPELDLPLLPEIVVEDDVEKLACNIYNLAYEEYLHIRENVSQTRELVEAEYEHLGLEIPNKYFDVLSFIAGYNYNSATKTFSEDDLRKAVEETVSWWEAKTNEKYGKINTSEEFVDELIQSLKQPKTPKWFVAETITMNKGYENSYPYQECDIFKTTTINNKTYLVGTYLYE